jgi:predicted O-methyltransferase YrrM
MAKRGSRNSFLLLAFCFLISAFAPRIKNGTYSRVRRKYTVENLDVFDFMLNPVTSRRDNFGALFQKALKNNRKTSGNFLEIGGGSGKFFDHNMKNFGDIITRYVLIEPYASEEFTQVVQKWMIEVERSPRRTTNITVIHDFSTSNAVITSFPDNYFDFVYIDGDHSYKGSKSDLKNYYPKVERGGVISGHDYCCSYKESKEIVHAPWCGRYIYPHSK